MNVVTRCTLALLAAVLLLGVASGCNKLKEIPGNISGQVIDPSGVGLGYITVQLIDPATAQVMYQETTEDSGNFFFKGAESGKYQLVVMGMGQVKYTSDITEVNLPPGKTVQLTVSATPPAKTDN